MPNIYGSLEAQLVLAPREAMADARSAGLCVGYFNLRGWENLAGLAEHFSTKAGDTVRYASLRYASSRPITGAVGRVLAEHYGLRDEEPDPTIDGGRR